MKCLSFGFIFLVVCLIGFYSSSTCFAQTSKNKPDKHPNISVYNDSYLLFGYADSPFVDKASFKFQFSTKINILETPFYIGYTQRSFMNLGEYSVPFYDHVFIPELFYLMPIYRLGPLHTIQWGVAHQSNGQREPTSRSWNYVYTKLHLSWDHLYIEPKLWLPFFVDDTNEDITDDYGYGVLQSGWIFDSGIHISGWNRWGKKFKRGAVGIDTSIPWPMIFSRLRNKTSTQLWLQGFYGRGETLIGYNVRTWSLSMGLGIRP